MAARSLFLVLLAFLSGCAAKPPLPEARAFADASRALADTSGTLVDQLAEAERRTGSLAARSRHLRAVGLPPGTPETDYVLGSFEPGDAVYFAEAGEPPLAEAMRRGISATTAYAEALLAIAEERPVDEARGQVAIVGANAGAVAGLAGIALPFAAAPFELLGSLAADLLRERNAEAFRVALASGEPRAAAVVDALVAATPVVFAQLAESSVQEFNQAAGRDPTAMRAAWLRVEGHRRAVANFAVLLRTQGKALDQLKLAVERPRSPTTLATLAEHSSRLRLDAEALRRAVARTGTGD